ncbi:hypothetical protein HHK36_024214 [Tetracentron sinense]|uniref:Uncharacterized protein n=1 Tax=Tetracentron sinense TaxID=13715 RepID=A0A834YKL4_TETSI|nr:hypothetical protein HHK36_024214 [Tetracentron sinense]
MMAVTTIIVEGEREETEEAEEAEVEEVLETTKVKVAQKDKLRKVSFTSWLKIFFHKKAFKPTTKHPRAKSVTTSGRKKGDKEKQPKSPVPKKGAKRQKTDRELTQEQIDRMQEVTLEHDITLLILSPERRASLEGLSHATQPDIEFLGGDDFDSATEVEARYADFVDALNDYNPLRREPKDVNTEVRAGTLTEPDGELQGVVPETVQEVASTVLETLEIFIGHDEEERTVDLSEMKAILIANSSASRVLLLEAPPSFEYTPSTPPSISQFGARPDLWSEFREEFHCLHGIISEIPATFPLFFPLRIHVSALFFHNRRNLGNPKVKFAEMMKPSTVQPYKCNGDNVVFLNPYPQWKPLKSNSGHSCEICYISLTEPYDLCSIACKVSVVSQKASEDKKSPSLSVPAPVISDSSVTENQNPEQNLKEDELVGVESGKGSNETGWNSNLKPRKRLNKRKGIP